VRKNPFSLLTPPPLLPLLYSYDCSLTSSLKVFQGDSSFPFKVYKKVHFLAISVPSRSPSPRSGTRSCFPFNGLNEAPDGHLSFFPPIESLLFPPVLFPTLTTFFFFKVLSARWLPTQLRISWGYLFSFFLP